MAKLKSKTNTTKKLGARSAQASSGFDRNMIGNKLSFAAREAYKLLRTNLSFCMSDEEGCKVIGVTSSLKGEGKSTTAINLAYTLAEAGNRVCLIEADMRMPTLGSKMRFDTQCGLSNLLADQKLGNDVLQNVTIGDVSMKVVLAGDVPPNPSELLGSTRMLRLIETFRKFFDFIIIDLPPILAVSDALVVSKLTNGVVLVVRQEYCTKKVLAESMRQMEIANVNLLGFVMTGSKTQEKGDYKRYGYGYGYEV